MFRTVVYLLFVIVAVNGFPADSDVEGYYRLYTRDEWGAKPSTDQRPLQAPVPYVIIHHTAVPAACHTTEECMADMRSMQDYHNSLGWGDIGYHFCVGSEGGAYEGRGWEWVGIHAGHANGLSVGLCLIGDWRVDEPPAKMLKTTKALIADGIRKGVISPSYKLVGHQQAMATECPGRRLMDIISKWDHYWPGHVDANKNKN